MTTITVKDLLEAGVHFGHRTQRWNPKMRAYIFEARHGIYLINLDQTAEQISRAQQFLRQVAAEGRRVLFVGCKKQAQSIIGELAPQTRSYHVTHRWLGGTLTNLTTIRRSIQRMKQLESMETRGTFESMPKKEVASMRRELVKLQRNLNGLRDMDRLPSALVVVDTVRENTAVQEARRLGIPVVGIVDTNADPSIIDYPIAANDDAIRSLRLILSALHDAVTDGQANLASEKTKAAAAVAKEKAPAAAVATAVAE